jgi:hypothetical protein
MSTFSLSSQRRHWVFESLEALQKFRLETRSERRRVSQAGDAMSEGDAMALLEGFILHFYKSIYFYFRFC